MNNKFKKSAALLLFCLMFFMVACSDTGNNNSSGNNDQQNGTSDEAPEEVVTLKVFHSNIGTIPSNILDNPVMQEIEESIGVKLDFSPFNGGSQEDANQRLSTLIASGELPDIIINSDQTINQQLVNNNLIEPLDSLLEQYGSDLISNVQEGLDYSKAMYSRGNDELYFVPGLIGDESFYPMGYDLVFQIRGDLLYAMDKDGLNSLDELLEYGKKAQELEPETDGGQKTYLTGIPFADPAGWDYVDWNISHNDGFAGVGGFNYLDLENNKLVPRFTDPDNTFWKSMSFWNEAYLEGLLDPESATMQSQQVKDKGTGLRYHLGLANWQIGWPNDVIRSNHLDSEKGFIPTLVDAKDNHNFFRFSSPVGNNMLWSISAKSENKEKAMAFMNFAASWDGVELMWNGPEGHFWEMTDGIPKTLPEDPDNPMDADEARRIGNAYMSPNFIINGKTTNEETGWRVKYGDNVPELYMQNMTKPEKDFIELHDLDYPTQIFETRENYSADTSLIDPVSPDPNSDISAIEQSIGTYLDTHIARIVYAGDDAEFESLKENFIAELKNMGIEQVMEYYENEFEANKLSINEVN